MSSLNQLILAFYQDYLDRYYELAHELEKASQLTEQEAYYLGIIYQQQPMTLSNFASSARVSRPAATQIAQKFIKRSLISKTPSPNDKRSSYLSLSADMLSYFQKTENIQAQVLSEMTAKLRPREREDLEEMLKKTLNRK